MAGSTRIKGTKLALTLGTPGVDHWADITSWELLNDEAESDVTTFEDASKGGSRQFKLKGSAIQSTATGSFWAYAWANTGMEVAYTLAPHGNVAPTVGEPHFAGMLTIGPKPSIGGEAGTGAFTFDFEWNITDEPAMLTGE